MVTLWSPTLSTRSAGGACARSPSAATWSALASTAPLHTRWWKTRTPSCAARQDARKSVAVSTVRSISITPQSFGDNTKPISGMPVDLKYYWRLEGSAGMQASTNIRDFGVSDFVLFSSGLVQTLTNI